MQRLKEWVALFWMPLFSLVAFGAFYLVWIFFDMPSQEQLIVTSGEYFEKYGLITIFVSAILESVLMMGWYYPGSLVIVLGAVLAGDDLVQLSLVWLVTTLGFIISYIFNFYVGKYGWYRLISALGFREALEKAKSQLVSYGPRAIFFTYWHPNLAALTATAAGILSIPIRTFLLYSLAATVPYNITWTTLAYILGEKAIDAIGPKFVLAVIAIWVLVILVRKRKPSLPPEPAPAPEETQK